MSVRVLVLPVLALFGCSVDYNVSNGDTDVDGSGVDTDPPDTDDVDTDGVDTDVVDTDGVDTDVVDTDATTDRDHDSVADADDVCAGLDDRVDLNQDATPDCAQNLLSNGQVTVDLQGWSDQRISSNLSMATFSSTDANGWAYSGSMLVVNQTSANMANAAGMHGACVSANPGDAFDVWYQYTVPSGGGNGPQFITSFDTYTDSACATPAASTTPGPPATVIGPGWHVMHMGSPITMWAAWHSFRVRIELYKPGLTTPLTFGLDDVLVLPQ